MPRKAVTVAGAATRLRPSLSPSRPNRLFSSAASSGPTRRRTNSSRATYRSSAARSSATSRGLLAAAGKTLDNVVKATVYLVDMGDFAAMNETYAPKFSKPYPARTCIAVAALPLGARVEIEVIVR